jgi:dTDP-4-amino-4,6-dideoxygalactose transaminase
MALHGISKDAWKRYTAEGSWNYEILAPGFKYNMTDIAAGMGLAQLRKAEKMSRRREEIAIQYDDAFGDCEELRIPHRRADCKHAWHLYMLRLRPDKLHVGRDQFIQEMRRRNIGTSVHFVPLHVHPYYINAYSYEPDEFPIAHQESQRELSLPIYSKMTDDDVQDVIRAVLDIIAAKNVIVSAA